ncbi:S49 family peptidase [Rickettsiella grylli]|uniref:Protease n=1 Tax=Rickettsiella grylli TaxID=59196 RepID=A8PQ17_9COXI|nr:S49 family peptidase [Rickettsiella grylli]EDP45913.1 protease [Rickettsiella grylli]EDP46669.1 protease [Rickettsiella grylli]
MAEELLSDPTWQRKTLEKLLFEALKEQRRKRRWNIFFKFLLFLIFLSFLLILWPSTPNLPTTSKAKAHIGLVDIKGIINDNSAANADNVIEGLQNAFEDKNTRTVILRINSPGGSPVQAAQIYHEIRYLRHQYPKTKLYAVCDDLCASAAYYIASASDRIYANPSSLVGSIGVLMDGFGFVETMKKVGVERRLLTAGDHKGFLDPFSPEKLDEKRIAERMLANVHQQFIHAVKQGRGNRLKNNPELFSGLAWTGEEALPLGLIDGFGDLNSLSRELIKNKNIVDYTVKPGLLQQLSDRIGAAFAQQLSTNLGILPHGFR